MRAKNTISIGRNSRRFIKCFRLSGNTTGTIEKGREKKKRQRERERSKDYSIPSKRRQKGPYRIPAETGGQALLACVNRNPYLCLSSTDASVTPRHGGPRRGNRTRGKKERGRGGKNFRPPFVQQVLGSWPQMLPVCIHQFSSRIVTVKTYDIAF